MLTKDVKSHVKGMVFEQEADDKQSFRAFSLAYRIRDAIFSNTACL